MAIYSAGIVAGAISGKLGGIVFVQAKKNAVVRMRPATRAAISPRQQTALSRFTALQRAWADLTDAERLTWKTAASGTLSTNRLGSSSPPGAFQLYVRENSLLQLFPATALDEPPVGPRSTPPRSVVADFEASGNYNIQANPGGTALSGVFYVYGWTQCKDYFTDSPPRFVHMLTQGAPSLNSNIQDAWGAVFGPLLEDQVFTVGVRNRIAANMQSDMVIIRGTTAA